MANASKKHMGPGAKGKGDGSGAMTDVPKDMIPENIVLSNHDKKLHSAERGLDSRGVQNEQLQDQVGNQLGDEDGEPAKI